MFIIGGIEKTSFIDFPNKVAAVVFTQGCNFRCGYCHNPELLKTDNNSCYSIESFIDFLKTRQGKLDGIVITGGEPTLQTGLYDFIYKIKALGFAVKLDTNGTNHEIIEHLVNNNLLDYIAMDIKAPLEKYSQITNINVNTESIFKSIQIIMNSNVDYEFRTTVVKSQLSFDDFDKIGQLIKGAPKYYIQKFIPSKVYNEKFLQEISYKDKEILVICENLKKYIQLVNYR